MKAVAGGLGVRFTPPALARRLAAELFAAGDGPAAVLDPACGDGELLLAAWEASGRCEALAAEGLWGIELDAQLTRRARQRLRRAIGGAPGERAAQHVRTADGLDPTTPWPGPSHVLANPPWVSLSGRQAARLPAGMRERYLSDWPAGNAWPTLHGAFLERIARHLARHGTRARVLLPSSLGHQERSAALRRCVTAHARLDGTPCELGEDAFEGVVEPSFLLALEGRDELGDGSSEPWNAPQASRLVERLAPFPRLAPEAFADPGVHTGNARAELILSPMRPGLPGVRRGRDLRAYRLGPPTRSLAVELERSVERRFRIGSLERQRSAAVLVRQTAAHPIAALHTEPTYFQNSLLACYPPAELDPAFVVAVLNSTLAETWHRSRFRDALQRSFPQVKVGHLRSLPFPFLRREENARLHDRLAQLVRRLAAGDDDPRTVTQVERGVLDAFGLSPDELAGPGG